MHRLRPRHVRQIATSLVLGLIVGLLTGCAALDQVIQKPTVAFDGLDLANASLLESTLNFRFKINNPNPIGLRTGRASYDLRINGNRFTKGQIDEGISVPSKTVGILKVPVTVAYLDFLNSISDLVREQTAAYDLSGSVAVGPVNIPFKANGRFDLPRMPKISVTAVNINRLSLAGASLICRLQLDNANAFEIPLKQLSYTLRLGDQRIASANVDPNSAFGRRGKSSFDVRMDLSFADIGMAAYQLFRKSGSEYHISGKMLTDSATLGERLVPFDASGRVPFFR